MSFSEPKTFEAREVRDYEKRRYRGLDQRLVDTREKRILRKILKSLSGIRESDGHEKPALRILDAPCGYGRFAGLVLNRGARLFAADISHSMAARARESSGERTVSTATVCNLIRGLPFKDGSFDYILSMRFFHHLHDEKDRLSVLREYARVASAGVVLSYYRRNRLHALQRVVRAKLKQRKYKICMIPAAQFEDETKRAGFAVARVVPLFRGLHAQHIVLLMKSAPGGIGVGCREHRRGDHPD